MKRLLLLALLLAGTALPGNAQQPVSGEVAAAPAGHARPLPPETSAGAPAAPAYDTRRPVRRPPLYGRHEFRLSAGFKPLRFESDEWGAERFGLSVGEQFDLTKYYRSDIRSTGTYALSYAYRFRRWFSLAAVCSYSGERFDLCSNLTGSRIRRHRLHRFSLMPVARFTWLNRPLVRLYSSLGIGFQAIGGDRAAWGIGESQAAFNYIPLGIAVGRSLFGFAEFGLSSQGCVAFGIGYSFNGKKRGA